tara:strand:+ start:40 stop:552 length:513 start_codon:yes stop_codon:yes gene_type:complete
MKRTNSVMDEMLNNDIRLSCKAMQENCSSYLRDEELFPRLWRQIYKTLFDQTGNEDWHTGWSTELAAKILPKEKRSKDHFYGGKNFSTELLKYTKKIGEVPSLEYIQHHLREKGGWTWVIPSENRLLTQNEQNYDVVSKIVRSDTPLGKFVIPIDQNNVIVHSSLKSFFR